MINRVLILTLPAQYGHPVPLTVRLSITAFQLCPFWHFHQTLQLDWGRKLSGRISPFLSIPLPGQFRKVGQQVIFSCDKKTTALYRG